MSAVAALSVMFNFWKSLFHKVV